MGESRVSSAPGTGLLGTLGRKMGLTTCSTRHHLITSVFLLSSPIPEEMNR